MSVLQSPNKPAPPFPVRGTDCSQFIQHSEAGLEAAISKSERLSMVHRWQRVLVVLLNIKSGVIKDAERMFSDAHR